MSPLLPILCVLAATACRRGGAEPAPAPLDQQRPLVLRYCVVPPDDAGPAMTLDEAIQAIEERVANDRVPVHAVDDEIVVELPGSEAEPRDLAEVLRGAGPALQPCPSR